MTRTRLLVADMPPMLWGILRALATKRSAIDIVAELEAEDDLMRAARAFRPDVVLMSASGVDGDGKTPPILYSCPRIRVVVVSPDARTASLHRLLPHRTRIDDLSPQELLDAIQGRGRFAEPGLPR